MHVIVAGGRKEAGLVGFGSVMNAVTIIGRNVVSQGMVWTLKGMLETVKGVRYLHLALTW